MATANLGLEVYCSGVIYFFLFPYHCLGSVLLGVVYKDLNELFETNQTDSNTANKSRFE